MYYSREQWGATVPQSRVGMPKVNMVFIHHTVMASSGDSVRDMKAIENVGRSRFGIFSYSWVIMPNGDVLEGAGHKRGAHTGGNNSKSFGIAFHGNFQTQEPTKEAIAACCDLIKFLKAGGILYKSVRILGHRDVKATACPGNNLYNAIPTIRLFSSAPLVAGPSHQPQPKPQPKQPKAPLDPKAIRKYAAGVLGGHLAGQKDMDGSSEGLHVVVLQRALNLIIHSKLEEDGKYGQQTIDAVLAFQRYFKVDGDFPGAAQRHTRWIMVSILRQIAEGKG